MRPIPGRTSPAICSPGTKGSLVRPHHAAVVLSRRERLVRAAGAHRRRRRALDPLAEQLQAFPRRHRPPRDAADLGRGRHGHPCRRGSRQRGGANRRPGFRRARSWSRPHDQALDRDRLAQRPARREAPRHRRGRVRYRRDLRERPLVVRRQSRAMSDNAAAISALRSARSSRFAISRACPSRNGRAISPAPSASST